MYKRAIQPDGGELYYQVQHLQKLEEGHTEL